MNAKELSRYLAERAADVVAYLLPAGKKSGAEWKVGSADGEPGKSLSIRLRGDRAGLWKDFAGEEGGDLLDLWCAVRRCGVSDAMREAKQWAGIKDDRNLVTAPKLYQRPARPKAKRPDSDALAWLHKRGLTDETIAAFKVAADGDTVLFPYLRADGELVNIKHRSITDKSKMWQSKDAEPCLFGWHLIDAKCRVVAITEGEPDAMVLHQVGIPALSVNQGAGNHQWLESDWDRLERFSEILVCFDDDDPGRKGAREVANKLGIERCRLVTFPGHKDANDALLGGYTPELFRAAVEDGSFIEPEELLRVDSLTDQVIAAFYPPEGSDPLPALRIGCDHDWFRFRPGEVTTWTGFTGHGKTTLLNLIEIGLIEQGEKVCKFSGEMPALPLMRKMARQACGMESPSIPYLRHIMAWLGRSLWLFNVVGQANAARLLDVFTYAVRRHGVTHLVVDSLMMIEDIPEDGHGSLEAQRKFMNKLVAFAKTHRVHVHLVAHPRKRDNEKETPGKQDVSGSAKIVSMADNHFSVWSREYEEGNTAPDSKLTLHKQRNGDTQHRELWLWFDVPSQQHCPTSHRRVRQFGEWERSA